MKFSIKQINKVLVSSEMYKKLLEWAFCFMDTKPGLCFQASDFKLSLRGKTVDPWTMGQGS